MKILTLSEVVSRIPKTANIFIHGAAATPVEFFDEIVKQYSRFERLTFYQLHTEGGLPHLNADHEKKFRFKNLFVGANIRPYVDLDRIDFIPCFLSEVSTLFRSKRIALDVALIQVSPPDRHGYCSLGTSVDVGRAALESAGIVLALINKKMPRVLGDGIVHVSQIEAGVNIDRPIFEHARHTPNENEMKIGKLAADLIEDGSTLQVGIGVIPDAVLRCLKDRKNLGVHSEMWSDGMLELIQSGAVTNRLKKIHPGKSVSGFVMGTQALYDFIHDNPSVIQLDSSYVNNPTVIARNPKVVAINSAVEVDLTGQVCADSVGSRVISGVGGQMDFIRGASISVGGKPIIAITSRTTKGAPRIVPVLKTGAGVVTTRAHVHWVITEYGTADLYGKSVGDRAKLLINIAHPDDRERLDREFHEIHKSRNDKY